MRSCTITPWALVDVTSRCAAAAAYGAAASTAIAARAPAPVTVVPAGGDRDRHERQRAVGDVVSGSSVPSLATAIVVPPTDHDRDRDLLDHVDPHPVRELGA